MISLVHQYIIINELEIVYTTLSSCLNDVDYPFNIFVKIFNIFLNTVKKINFINSITFFKKLYKKKNF